MALKRQPLPLVQYWGRREGIPLSTIQEPGPAPRDGFPIGVGNDDIKSGDDGGGGGVRLWGLGFHSVLSVLEGVGDGRSGTQFQGAGGQPGSAPCSCVTWQTSEGFSPEGVSTTSFSIFPDPLGGVGGVFSRCRRWVNGDLRGERRGRFSKGHKARVFRQGS